MCKHNPHVDWALGKVIKWSWSCQSSCLLSPHPLPFKPFPEFPDLLAVLEVYLNLKKIFSKPQQSLCHHAAQTNAPLTSSLEQHHPRDSYSLSAPERKAMDKYIHESLTAGIICPSSLAGAGFFFIEKKRRRIWTAKSHFSPVSITKV